MEASALGLRCTLQIVKLVDEIDGVMGSIPRSLFSEATHVSADLCEESSCSIVFQRPVYEAEFLSIDQRFLAARKDFDRMMEFFLGSKRDEFTPHFFSHDVFVSFRGKDVRETLVHHLSQSLSKAGLRVFLDTQDLMKGAKIWPSLESAIGKSRIRIPVFSEGYAESTWCLRESVAMLETPHLIIPLFYGVDPTDVRYPLNKRSPYKISFEKHYGHPDRHPQAEIDGWKSALQDICSRSGWTMGVTQDCHVAVEGIVKDVIDILRSQEK